MPQQSCAHQSLVGKLTINRLLVVILVLATASFFAINPFITITAAWLQRSPISLSSAALTVDAVRLPHAPGKSSRGFNSLAVAPTFVGATAARNALEQNLAQPLALATADFDEDGMPDLVGGYGGPQGGILALYQGNVDAVYPNTPDARRRRQKTTASDTPSPFLSSSNVFDLPVTPDFIGVGDFNADGHPDLVAAARGGDKLYLIAGDGRGGFAEAKAIELSGRVTALTVGEINRADGLADVIVGIADADRAKVLVFEGPEGALRAQPETFALSAEATELAVGRLDGDYLFDLAVAAGQELIVVHGRDRRLSLTPDQRDAVAKANVDRQSLGVAIKSIAIGSFTDALHSQVAALGEDGEARVMTVGKDGKWRSDNLNAGSWPQATRLLSARVSGGQLDDLVVQDAGVHELYVVNGKSETAGKRSVLAATIESKGVSIAVLPMRLHADARNDLVILQRGQSQPTVISPEVAATFVVTSVADLPDSNLNDGICDAGGAIVGVGCTLRAAIQQANFTPSVVDTINFDIPIEFGAPTITVLRELDAITAPVMINATTQAGGRVVLTGGPNIGFGSGLVINASNCLVSGLVINGFGGDGIVITGSNNVIEGNFIGTDESGTLDRGNVFNGVRITSSFEGGNTSTNNRVGGTAAAARNVISGNGNTPAPSRNGVQMEGPGTTGNFILGNYIGVDATGKIALGNTRSGVVANFGASNNLIGGTATGSGNLIFANTESGVYIQHANSTGNRVQGNLIGAGNGLNVGNGLDGVTIDDSSDNSVGGTTPAARNVISNNGRGISIVGANATGSQVQGNFIGTDSAGTASAGNIFSGVQIGNNPILFPDIGVYRGGTDNARSSLSGLQVGLNRSLSPKGLIQASAANISRNSIGGIAAGAGNVIAFNGRETGNGVTIVNTSTSNPSFVNPVLSNLIFSNRGLGIDLGGNGVTDNDAGDSDAGPNNLQNYPVLQGVVNKGAVTTIIGTLNSTPNTTFRIEFFSNAACDSSGFGEGETFISFTSVTTNANGTANFSLDLPTAVPLGRSITATATDPNGNTSEFSRCAQVIACPIYPNGFVPFAAVDAKFITAPDANGDRVIVGPSTIAALNTIQSSVALPQFPNEQFCVEVMLAPNLLAIAYVPSAIERSGNFSAFGQPLIDPFIGQPFPGNIIPSNRLGGIYAWRVRSFRFLNADLAIAKTDAPDPVLAGNNLTYTITVTNNGPAASTNTVVTDTLTGLQVALVSATTTAPNGVCTPTSASSIACTLGTLNAGASVSATIVVRPAAPGTLTNTATIRSDFDPNPDNNVAVATTIVLPEADLAVTIADSPDPVLVNNLLTYSINVANNNGPTIATGVVLTSALPAGVTLSSAGATQGTCGALVGGQITCNLGTINVGSSVAVTIIVNVLPVAAGTISNTVSVRGDGSDPNPRNDTATAPTVVIPVANLVLTKTTTTLLPGPGDDLSYTLRIANAGPNDAAEVVLADDIPTNTVFKSLSDVAGWTCTKPAAGSTGSISCGIRALANGASATFTLVVTVGSNVVKDTIITNTARATTSSSDGDMSNNTSTALARIGAPVPLVRAPVGGAVEVGPIAALPQPSANPPTSTFLIENGGNATLFLTPLSVTRLGPDGGKFASPADDRSLFDIRRITPSGDIPLLFTANGVIPVLPGQQVNFRVRFNPIIPTRGCRTTNLAANQALPEMINSQLRLLTQSGVPVDVALVGRLSTVAKLIHPGNPTLPALVTLTQSGRNVKVESWVYDSNMDIYLARYQFFDGTGNPLGDPVDAEFGQSISAAGLVRGQVFGIEQNFETDSQVASVRVTIYDPDNVNDSALSGPGTPPQCTLPTVSAASFNGFGLSSESIVAGFGANLAAGVQVAANNPLPTSLGGTSVRIRDGAGIERPAPLFFVSPAQINYQIPAGVSPGAATVTVMNGNAPVATDILRITQSWPGLFAANGNGAGVAAAVALRVKADGTQSYEPVARFDQALNQNVSIPINLGGPTDQIYLIFYGTGIRNHNVFDAVKMWIGGVELPLLYAGAQGDFAGLDQINVALPRTLSGRGEVDVVLAVGNSVANKVQVNIGGAPNLLANAVSPSFAEMLAQSPAAKPDPLSVIVMPTIKLPARVAAR